MSSPVATSRMVKSSKHRAWIDADQDEFSIGHDQGQGPRRCRSVARSIRVKRPGKNVNIQLRCQVDQARGFRQPVADEFLRAGEIGADQNDLHAPSGIAEPVKFIDARSLQEILDRDRLHAIGKSADGLGGQARIRTLRT